MTALWELDGVNTELSAAALDPRRWKPALQRLSDTVGGVGVLFIPVNHRTEQIATDGVLELADRYVQEGWYLREVRARGLPAMLRRGIMVDQDFITLDEVRNSEYYNDALGPQGLRWFAGIRTDDDDDERAGGGEDVQRIAEQACSLGDHFPVNIEAPQKIIPFSPVWVMTPVVPPFMS